MTTMTEKERLQLTAQIASHIAGGYIASAGLYQEPKEVVRYSLDIAHLMIGALLCDEETTNQEAGQTEESTEEPAVQQVGEDGLPVFPAPRKRGRPPKRV